MRDNEMEILEVMENVLFNGVSSKNRTITKTIKSFGLTVQNDIHTEGFNALESKFLSMPTLMKELHWFCDGDVNVNTLTAQDVKIWNLWKDEQGRVGPMYSEQWRAREEVIRLDKMDPEYHSKFSFLIGGDDRGSYQHEQTNYSTYFYRKFDQLQYCIDQLNTNPDSRRILVDTWNTTVLPVADIDPTEQAALGRQALAPCHVMYQFGSMECEAIDLRERCMHHVTNEGDSVFIDGYEVDSTLEKLYTHEGFFAALKKIEHLPSKETRVLNLAMFQRSVDLFLGCPFNMASYAALMCYVAAITNHIPSGLSVLFGDTHIYANHIEQVQDQIEYAHDMDDAIDNQIFVAYNVPKDLRGLNESNWRLFNYVPGPVIKGTPAK